MMDDSDIQQTAIHLWKAANTLSRTCPAASRICLSTLSKHIGNSLMNVSFVKSSRHCKYCGSLWQHLNHKIRIQPIPSPNCHIKKLLKWEKEQPWKLNYQQKKKLKKYRESTNKIVYTCNVCKKATEFIGLKKCSAKEQKVMSTPAPKIKLKKGDLNAGLFITTPIEKKIPIELENDNQDDKCQNDISLPSTSTPKIRDSCTPKDMPKIKQKTHFTIEKNATPQITSSSRKRRKGLLAQILHEEQEAKQKKKTLSSFLTSL